MSRTGRVQLGIKRAFTVGPEWSTRELMEWTHTMPLYRGGRSYRDRLNYCRSIGGLPSGWQSGLAGAGLMALSGGCAYRMLTRIANNTVSS